jgi:hypothetical protein
MIEYRRQTPDEWPGLFRFAVDNPPRSTPRQATRWDTQDAAYAARDGTQVARVRDAIAQTPGTCDEIEQRLDMSHQSTSAAINKLMREGIIRANGQRPTRSGRMARVWELVPK